MDTYKVTDKPIKRVEGPAMSMSWDAYLNVPSAAEQYSECSRNCRNAFHRQRENIERVFTKTSPRAVACLGAGVLNDIPYGTFIAAGATVHLVDWLPGSVDTGIKLSIITTGEDGQPNCAYCNPAIPCPERYCRHFYDPTGQAVERVCDHYVPSTDLPLHCAAFERFDLPSAHYADVTAGYANDFANAVSMDCDRIGSWNEAFTFACALADRIRHQRQPLDIPDDGVQMVTSSLVVSQFEHEPYGYFAQLVASRIGLPTPAEENGLLPRMEDLRTMLLSDQIERHCEEIDRILAPGGRCYLSSEMFHWLPEKEQWFMVEGTSKLLEVIGRHFNFNFSIVPEMESLSRFEMRNGVSLVCSFVLESRKEIAYDR